MRRLISAAKVAALTIPLFATAVVAVGPASAAVAKPQTPEYCTWQVKNTDSAGGLKLREHPSTGATLVVPLYDGTQVSGDNNVYSGSGLVWYDVKVTKLNAGNNGNPKDPSGDLGKTGYVAAADGGTTYLTEISCS
jgi:hypothetical protein